MKKIVYLLLVAFFIQTTPVVVLATETMDTHPYEENISIINNMAFRYVEIGQSLIFRDGERSFYIDNLIVQSNEGFFLHLYDLIYQEEPQFMTSPRTDVETSDIYYLYDMSEERRLHINRLVIDGYIRESDLSITEWSKSEVARILYGVYKDVLPYQGSVSYTDTDEISMLWAAERGLPYYLNRSGYEIYPDQKMSIIYLDCLRYAALYFPNPASREYLTLNNSDTRSGIQFSDDRNNSISYSEGIKIIDLVRKEVTKPRLGYWVRDVLKNPKMANMVKDYLNSKSDTNLKIVKKQLKDEFNLLEYQDDQLYIKYMFKLFK